MFDVLMQSRISYGCEAFVRIGQVYFETFPCNVDVPNEA